MYRMCCLSLFLFLTAAAGAADTLAAEDGYTAQRHALVRRLGSEMAATGTYHGKEALDPRVVAALNKVPRHEFVPSDEQRYAYENRPLPIGYGQTISQPYVVALMTALLDLKPQDRVLEVGTGSGYQAAILAELAQEVYSVEIIEPLAKRASALLTRLGYRNVSVRIGDGYYGWRAHAPFDAIVVTAAASHVPPPLIEQLKPGGRMVIPVGSRFMTQELLLVEKSTAGQVTTRQILPVAFVPLTGGH